MQATFQTRQHKHIFASAVIKELEAETLEKMKSKKLTMIDKADENITQKIIEYNRVYTWICGMDDVDQRGFFPILKRIKAEAIGAMVNLKAANESQLRQLDLTEDDILFEIELKQLLADWVELESDESLIARQEMRMLAFGGKRLNYCSLNSLQEDLKLNNDREKQLLEMKFSTTRHREKYDKYGHEIDPAVEKMSYQDINEELSELIPNRIQIKKKINLEKWRVSDEKSEAPNLCYFILFDDTPVPTGKSKVKSIYDPITLKLIGYEDNDRINYRIRGLSKHYLKIMVSIICKINNEYFKDDIETNRKILKKMNRQKKKISIPEKRELIQLGKAEGLTNEQISQQLGKGFALRTVERYSK